MKIMVNNKGTKLKVIEHIILSNRWEYYVTTDKYNKDIVRCLVMGFETELGDVYMPEIEPYIISRKAITNNSTVLPATGWRWE